MDSSSGVIEAGNTVPTGPRGDGNGRGHGGRGRAARGRGRGESRGGRGKKNAGRSVNAGASTDVDANPTEKTDTQPEIRVKNDQDNDGNHNKTGDDDPEAEVCFICANPVAHSAIAPCNHITCHICALRMRALYKNKECPHCRTLAPFVIFTDDVNKRFDEYSDGDITSADENIGIRYTSEDIVGDTVLLLRYNCPDPDCDFAGLGWPALHRHTRSVHNKRMCDLCTRNKKVFTHEHELFTDKALGEHMRRGDDKPGAIDQTGFKGHPLCAFCGERFYDDDKLYEHCRHKHERCFLCDRRDSRQPHYYRDYNALEKHFKDDHFLCADRECMEKKFVVFDTEMDLKAHQLSEHGSSLSKDVRRDARTVDMASFDFRPSYQHERRSGGGGGGGSRESGREGRGRGRDPNAEPLPMSSAQPLRRDELAFQRQMAIHSAQSVTTRTFGGQLSQPSAPGTNGQGSRQGVAGRGGQSTSRPQTTQAPEQESLADPTSALSHNDMANLTPQDHARLARHGAVIERAKGLLGNDDNKLGRFRQHISSYRQGALSAPQLVDAFFSLFSDTSSNALGTLIREVSELFDDRAKGEALRKAWQDWRAINEDYPSLPGLGGMHGATTSTSGWASAAVASPTQMPGNGGAQNSRHTTRVLRLKNSTRRGSTSSMASSAPSAASGSSSTVPGANWVTSSVSRRPPPQASASAAFPALPSARQGGNSSRQQTQQSSWVGGTSSAGRGSNPGSAPRPAVRTAATAAGGGSAAAPPPSRRTAAGEDAFPALPAAPKPLTTIFGYGTGAVRRDLGGGSRNTGFSWGGGAEASGSGSASAANAEDGPGTGKEGKKKKQGKKQVLVQWG